MFFHDLLSAGLDHAAYKLFLHRVHADHYALNPTKVLLLSWPWKRVQDDSRLDDEVLRVLLEMAYEVLEHLESM